MLLARLPTSVRIRCTDLSPNEKGIPTPCASPAIIDVIVSRLRRKTTTTHRRQQIRSTTLLESLSTSNMRQEAVVHNDPPPMTVDTGFGDIITNNSGVNSPAYPVRIDQGTKMASVYDFIRSVTGVNSKRAPVLFDRVPGDLKDRCVKLKPGNARQETPCADAATVGEILKLLRGEKAVAYRQRLASRAAQLDYASIDEQALVVENNHRQTPKP
jgi:hypothetical protein